MSYINEVHDATVCSSASCPCHLWTNTTTTLVCEDERTCQDIDAVLASLSPFAVAWGAAPESRRRYVEREDANYWFEQGERAERRRVLDDLREMNRLVKERLR